MRYSITFLALGLLLLKTTFTAAVATTQGTSEGNEVSSHPNSHHHTNSHHGSRNAIISDYLGFFRDAILNTHYHPFPESNDGREWPKNADSLSMLGQRRLDNFVASVMTVIADRIPGHVIETGVWRGGASMLVAKAIQLMGESANRFVYFCDSFKGIPPAPKHIVNGKDITPVEDVYAHTLSMLNENSVQKVKDHAKSFGIDEKHVVFVEGYFNESLPALIKREPNIQFSVIRLDGDTYFSTMDSITILYPHLVKGGFIIIDDYIDWNGCRQAVDEYRALNKITEPITLVPHLNGESFRGVFWRKVITTSDPSLLQKYPYCPGANHSPRPARALNPSNWKDIRLQGCSDKDVVITSMTCKTFEGVDIKRCV